MYAARYVCDPSSNALLLFLLLQDCSVGLMFALMPAFGAAAAASKGSAASSSNETTGANVGDLGVAVAQANSLRDAALLGAAVLLTKVLLKLVLVLAGAVAAARTVLPVLLRVLLRLACSGFFYR